MSKNIKQIMARNELLDYSNLQKNNLKYILIFSDIQLEIIVRSFSTVKFPTLKIKGQQKKSS